MKDYDKLKKPGRLSNFVVITVSTDGVAQTIG